LKRPFQVSSPDKACNSANNGINLWCICNQFLCLFLCREAVTKETVLLPDKKFLTKAVGVLNLSGFAGSEG
jgi:hypothetical protein